VHGWKTAQVALERLLEAIIAVLMTAMFLIVVLGVTYRKAGASIVWYDEIAEIGLAWLTYYGAAYAALKRNHIGVPTVLRLLVPAARKVAFVIAEAVVLGFFVLLAWVGYEVLTVLQFDFLASAPEISTMYTQSVIPIGAALFVIAEVLSLPEAWRQTVAGATPAH
jgi:TRAP-type C4-dicarboxylate transport system permease small subunit